MNKQIISMGFWLTILLLVAGCGTNSGGGPKTSVAGYVKSPNGNVAVVGVTVKVDGTSLETTTDVQGHYTLDNVASGVQTIIAVKGSFRAEVTVTAVKDQTIQAPDALLASIGKIGIVSGLCDNFNEILNDLGVTYEIITAPNDTFSDMNQLNQFKVIFFECDPDGHCILSPTTNVTECNNLKDFVSQGGSIYGSDNVGEDVFKALFPEKITWIGRVGDDQTVFSSSLDNNLRLWLGKTQAEIVYNLPAATVIGSVGTDVNVRITGNIDDENGVDTYSNKPLLVDFAYGQGYVVYTTFHTDAQPTQDMVKIFKQLAFEL